MSSLTTIECYRRSQQYPWQEADGKTPLRDDLIQELRKKWGGGRWIGEGALYSVSPQHGRIERKLIKQALKKTVSKIIFCDRRKARIGEIIRPLYKWMTGIDLSCLLDLLYNKNLQRGIPTEKALFMAYWRKPSPVPSNIDPDKDGCGIIWLAPSVPFEGHHVRAALRIIEQTARLHSFEPNVGLQCVTQRSIDMTVAILYRLTTQLMNSQPPAQDDYGKLLQQIKKALDPNNILAPGRYDFRSDWAKSEELTRV